MSLQSFDSVILRQNLHLAYGDGIELSQSLGLRHPLVDEHRIQVFQIGEADQLRDIGVVSDISFQIRMAVPPLFCSHTEQGHVQNIGFTGIHHGDLLCGKLRRNQIFLDGVRMDAVVDLGQVSLNVPAKLFHFLGLKSLKLFDQIDFELRANPHAKLKGDVLVGVCAAISSSLCPQSNRTSFFDPLFDTELVAVQASLTSNCGEFAIIKIRVVDLFPYPEKFDRVSVSQPVRDEKPTVLFY